jgi:cytochrome c oxidase assembly protein subunit 15
MPSSDPTSPADGTARFAPWRHRMAVACAGATAALLAAGGLVTSTGSGLAVPDWPLSFGRVFPPMVGGVLYEHGHRLIAATVGLLTLALAVWFLLREPRRGVRRLAILAVAVVVLQGVLGGITVLMRLPVAVSVAHACLAQAFFCLMVALALLTSRGFTERPAPRLAADGAPPLRHLAAAATGIVFGQLVLGAVMRHTGAGLAIPDVPLAFGRLVPPLVSADIAVHFAHRVGALAAAAAIGWAARRAVRLDPGRIHGLAAPALVALALLAIQIALGLLTVATRLAVIPATAHLVVGALLLACCLVLTLRAARLRAPHGTLPAGLPVGEAA